MQGKIALYLASIAEHPTIGGGMNLYLAGEHSVKNGAQALAFKNEAIPCANIYSLERSDQHTHTHKKCCYISRVIIR